MVNCPSKQIILGIDPGYDRLGLAIVKSERGTNELIYSDCILSDKKEAFEKRLKKIGSELENILKKYKPDSVAIESLYFSVNQKTAIKVAETRGMIIYLCSKNNVEVHEYNPMQVKTCVTGFGGANKKQVIELVKKQINIKKNIKLDDEFDAVALVLTHLATPSWSKIK